MADKKVPDTDPSLDDDNKSDSDEEYEIEEYEEYEEVVDGSGSTTPVQVFISEVETVAADDKKGTQETHIVKTDGTTEKVRSGRTLTSQEESILLPLIQGLLAAGGGSTEHAKHENTPFRDNGTPSNAKNNKSNGSEQDTNVDPDGSNILGELSSALNRLQTTLLEEKDVVTDMRKRNTILTLVAWLKRILQTPSTSDNTTSTVDAQLFALTDLLPTELLLSKLMPQLTDAQMATGAAATPNEIATFDRLAASSKRFSRQRNKRFNTVGVSKEELADARLYLQKKLLTENLATCDSANATQSISKQMATDQQNILDDDADSRRKSLNLSFANDLHNEVDRMLENSNFSFSKSSNIVPAEHDFDVQKAKPVGSGFVQQQTTDAETKVVLRKKSNPGTGYNSQMSAAYRYNVDPHPTTDTDDDLTERQCNQRTTNINGPKAMNKFTMRKLKMKRANTIDVPKTQSEDFDSSNRFSDDNVDITNSNAKIYTTTDDVRRNIQSNCSADVDKNTLPAFQIKSAKDQKYLAFLNKQANEKRLSWVSPNRNSTSPHGHVGNNWSNKFGNIKNAFERSESTVSPGLSKKSSFTHASTSPFMPVHNSKPPQIPNGSHHVSSKIAAIQNQQQNMIIRPQLKSYKSLPASADVNGKSNDAISRVKPNSWSNKFTSVDNVTPNKGSSSFTVPMPTSFNPLYIPLHNSEKQSTQKSVNTLAAATTADQSSANTPVSPLTHPNEFPSYTYTCTDYTRPTCVSTFGPESSAPIIKNTILPDTSYLKHSPNRTFAQPQPTLGATRLSQHMKAVDYTSSSEYLSEPSSYRSPQPFLPANEYVDNYDSSRDSQEFTATSQIMTYPQCQTATVVNKTQRYDQDEKLAKNLHTVLTNNAKQKQRAELYNENEPSVSLSSPIHDTQFSQINQTYIPPSTHAYNYNNIRNATTGNGKFNNNFQSMENISTTKPSESSAPIRLRNDTSHYSSHSVFLEPKTVPNKPIKSVNDKPNDAHQSKQSKQADKPKPKPKPAPMVKLNSFGGQYQPPKVESPFDSSKRKLQTKNPDSNQTDVTLPSHVVMNNVTNLNRSQTITHRRQPFVDVKRKQSLPAQSTDYFDSVLNSTGYGKPSNRDSSDMDEPRHNYLPAGVLKKSKSGHTLALLQQFESKENTKNYSTKPTNFPNPLPSYVKVPTTKQAPTTPAKKIEPKKPTAPTTAPIKSPQNLQAPLITETPSSPIVESDHIIYPGQTRDTTNKVQNYAQTLNAILCRKAVINEDDGPIKGILQKSKSGTLLSLPKQYETVIKKSEVEEKQRTVAAYFSGNKSPQGLQRSSSQHSVLSAMSSSSRQFDKDFSRGNISARDVDINGNSNTDNLKTSAFASTQSVSAGTTATTTATKTTTKSAHHMKILKKQQQKQTSNSSLAKSQTMPHISSVNLLDESNVDDAFEDLFLSFNK